MRGQRFPHIGIYKNCPKLYILRLRLSGSDYLCSVFCVYDWQQLPCERNLYSLLWYLQAADPKTITCTQLMVSTTSLYGWMWCLQFQIHIQSRRGDGFVSVMEDCRETISQSLGLCHTEAHQPTTAPPPISSTNPLSCTLR